MKKKRWILLVFWTVAAWGSAAEFKPVKGVEEKANRIVYEASEFLRKLPAFRYSAKVMTDETLYNSVKIHVGGTTTVTVQRPNKVFAEFEGDERARKSSYDGKTLTVYSLTRKTLAQAAMPDTIDKALNELYDKYGYTLPLSDLVYSDPYEGLIANVEAGQFIGKHKVNGMLCNHLAFQQEYIDWEVWIEDSKTPYIRRLIITYKTEDGSPEFEAEFTKWTANPPIAKGQFTILPPAGVEKVEFLPADQLHLHQDEEEALEEQEAADVSGAAAEEKPAEQIK